MSVLLFALALAQPAQAPAHNAHAGHAAPAAPAAATAQRFSVNSSKVADLLANPAAKAIIEKHLPGFSNHPQIGMAGQLTLKAVQRFAAGQITDAHLDMIEKELAALPN